MVQMITAADEKLIAEASALLVRVHDAAITRVAAAALGKSGAVHLGVSLRSPRVSVCAESTAVANAKAAGEEAIETIVAVGLGEDGVPVVINPCGVCRELVPAVAPGVRVLVDDGGDVVAVGSPDLLPMPWKRARSYD
jgi:cytidine deaminase